MPEWLGTLVMVLLIIACLFAYGAHVLTCPDAGKRPDVRPRGIEPPDEARTAALQERYSMLAQAWRRWQETPRGPRDRDRLVTVEDVWGGPDPGESFPPRYTASHLGKVTLERRRYLSLEEEMTNGLEAVWAASPRAWASRRLDVWAVHSRGWRRPRLMRVWFNDERALVELHTNRSVKVDEILPSEIVGFVRGYTRLGPRTGVVDGLRWLPEKAMLMGQRPLTRTFRELMDLSVVSPVGSPLGDALRAGDFYALTFSCSRESAGWDAADSELRVLDVAGMTYQVGNALGCRPSDKEASSSVGDCGDEAGAVSAGLESSSGAADDGCGRVEPTDLAVVPVDPKAVLRAVRAMVELPGLG
jgi:hypothetical protein